MLRWKACHSQTRSSVPGRSMNSPGYGDLGLQQMYHQKDSPAFRRSDAWTSR